MKYLFAILGLVGFCSAQVDYTRCSQWSFKNCTDTITKNLDNLYHHYDKCGQAKAQTEKLSDCRYKFMDGCEKDKPYKGWGTTGAYNNMDSTYNDVLSRIQKEEENNCGWDKHEPMATAEPSFSSCVPHEYMECVNNLEYTVQYKQRGPSEHTCMEIKDLTNKWNNCQMDHFSSCMMTEKSYYEAEEKGRKVINLLSDREGESCSSQHHYYMSGAATAVFKQGVALVAVASSLLLFMRMDKY